VHVEQTDLVTLATVLFILPAVAGIPGRPEGAWAVAMGAGFAIVGALWAYIGARALASHRRRTREVTVRAERGKLEIDGRVRFASIGSAYLQPRAGLPSTVRVANGFDVLDIAVADETRAYELLRALGTDPAQSVARFRVHQGIFANKKAQTAVAMIGTFGAVNALNLLPSRWKGIGFFVIALFAIINAIRSTVLVGPDGILVTSPWPIARK